MSLRQIPSGFEVVLPRRLFSLEQARRFVFANASWIERVRARTKEIPEDRFLYRGDEILLAAAPERLAMRANAYAGGVTADAVEQRLRQIARAELPARLAEFCETEQLTCSRVSVRGQSTKWGACNAHGRITLNWRLVMCPSQVSDYVIWHELAHTRHLHHGPEFWELVSRLCPDYVEQQRWLKRHGQMVMAWNAGAPKLVAPANGRAPSVT